MDRDVLSVYHAKAGGTLGMSVLREESLYAPARAPIQTDDVHDDICFLENICVLENI